MFLKKNSFALCLFLVLFFNSKSSFTSDNGLSKLIEYLDSIEKFSVSFIQQQDNEISEGKISIEKDRVRVDYLSPSNIIVILSADKAMYYNVELDEDEFFNPKDTSAWFFFEIFNNFNFFLDGNKKVKDGNIVLTKKGEFNNDNDYKLELFFEEKPVELRKIVLELNGLIMTLSIFGHNYNEQFDKNYFKLINPKFFD